MPNPNPFEWFKTSLEIIRLAVMLYVRFALSLRAMLRFMRIFRSSLPSTPPSPTTSTASAASPADPSSS